MPNRENIHLEGGGGGFRDRLPKTAIFIYVKHSFM
jgi:hypothetical protein